MGEDAKLAVKRTHTQRPTWYGERRWKQEPPMLLSQPSTENPGHRAVASGHTASVMQAAAAAALARSSKRADTARWSQ
jgi:hypothetical protein